jgi:DNA-directed RNA polymerase II subunit RPB7
MFFLYNLERRVTLHPSYFGKNMHELVTGKLLKDVEGTCTGSYYIISIMDTFDISEGRILPGSGLAEFTVGYRAVVWRPFKGETVRASSLLLWGWSCILTRRRLMLWSFL